MLHNRNIILAALTVILLYTVTWAEPNVPGTTSRSRDHVIMVSGINKDPDEQQRKMRTVMRFHEFVTQHMNVCADAWALLVDPETYMPLDSRAATATNIKMTLKQLARRMAPNDRLIFYYAGQANVVSDTLRFNLPGPDMTHEQLAQWLDEGMTEVNHDRRYPADPNSAVNHHLLILDCPGAGLALPELSRPDRIIVCGARSDQPYSTRFSDFFVPALSDTDNDINGDKQISLLEAFQAAVRQTDRMYQDNNLIKTENALLDDDGDGVPSQQPWRFEQIGTDGQAAWRWFFDRPKEQP